MASDEAAPRRLTEHPAFHLRPSFTPDGTKIAYLKEDAAAFRNVWTRNTGQLMWISADGEGGTCVATTDDQPTLDRVRGRIYYLSTVEPENRGTETKPKSVLVSVNLDGSDKKTAGGARGRSVRGRAFAVREDIFLVALYTHERGADDPRGKWPRSVEEADA